MTFAKAEVILIFGYTNPPTLKIGGCILLSGSYRRSYIVAVIR